MEENSNQQKSASRSTQEVVIRTMESDVKALEQGGGEVIIPQPIIIKEIEPEFEIPGYIGPEKPIFAPHSGVAAEKANEHHQSASRMFKIVGIVILILLVIAAFGFLGYFAVSYFTSSKQMPAVQ